MRIIEAEKRQLESNQIKWKEDTHTLSLSLPLSLFPFGIIHSSMGDIFFWLIPSKKQNKNKTEYSDPVNTRRYTKRERDSLIPKRHNNTIPVVGIFDIYSTASAVTTSSHHQQHCCCCCCCCRHCPHPHPHHHLTMLITTMEPLLRSFILNTNPIYPPSPIRFDSNERKCFRQLMHPTIGTGTPSSHSESTQNNTIPVVGIYTISIVPLVPYTSSSIARHCCRHCHHHPTMIITTMEPLLLSFHDRTRDSSRDTSTISTRQTTLRR